MAGIFFVKMKQTKRGKLAEICFGERGGASDNTCRAINGSIKNGAVVCIGKIRQNFVLTKEEKATDNGARQRLAIKDVGFRRRRDSLTARTCSSVQPTSGGKMQSILGCGATSSPLKLKKRQIEETLLKIRKSVFCGRRSRRRKNKRQAIALAVINVALRRRWCG